MKTARVVLGVGGAAAVGWGFWLVHDDGIERWRSQLVWFVAGVLAHDGLIAPVVVVLGVVAARLISSRIRPVVAVGFIVWATVTAAAANVLLPVGGRPDNPSLMNRPYVAAWLVFTVVTVLAVGAAVACGSVRQRWLDRMPRNLAP